MLEISFVDAAIGPKILSIPISHPIDVLPNIPVSILKYLFPVPILHTIAEVSFVEITTQVLPVPVRKPTQPIACVHLTRTEPIVASYPALRPLLEIANISIPIWLQLISMPAWLIIVVDSFKNFTIVVY